VAGRVEREVIDRIVELGKRGARSAAIMAKAVEAIAIRAAADQDRAIRRLGQCHRSDTRSAGFEACGECLPHEWAENLIEVGLRSLGRADGIPSSALVKSGFTAGCGLGRGGSPKLGGVVPLTVGTEPRLGCEPSSPACAPKGGDSRLPALSVASARNW